MLSPIRIALAAAALLAIAGAAYWIYDAIYDRGWDAHVIVSEKEKQAMRKANDQAIASAEKELREDLAVLLLEREKLENDLVRLASEAAQDPDANSGGIKRNGVRRINAIE
ncbi:hypothetical protein [Pararhizobium qamdonense]|uniref:hypothetical protein n=1 Tax=Pararhizobium qamdonense TaxID=3031126 RepID=UPI0023E1CCAC|nr:hypothetical protein [Pararhizobium qamdonense]